MLSIRPKQFQKKKYLISQIDEKFIKIIFFLSYYVSLCFLFFRFSWDSSRNKEPKRDEAINV